MIGEAHLAESSPGETTLDSVETASSYESLLQLCLQKACKE